MGDELPIGEALHSWDEVKDRKVSVPDYPKEVLVSVVPGPQEEYFTEAGIHHFYSESYEVTESCDRILYQTALSLALFRFHPAENRLS